MGFDKDRRKKAFMLKCIQLIVYYVVQREEN